MFSVEGRDYACFGLPEDGGEAKRPGLQNQAGLVRSGDQLLAGTAGIRKGILSPFALEKEWNPPTFFVKTVYPCPTIVWLPETDSLLEIAAGGGKAWSPEGA